jgi:hypothetical protein
MANVVYDNFVLEAKLNDLLNTKLNTRNLMTVDTSLAEAAGVKKTINKYTYTGAAEAVAKGSGNTEGAMGALTHTPTDYTVVWTQHTFPYYDEELAADPNLLDMGLEGGSTIMVNDMNSKYFTELAKSDLVYGYTIATSPASHFSYDVVVDAIALMNLESEEGLFLLISPSLKATIRKDSDFKTANIGQIIFNGQIGAISGIPVIPSKLVPTNCAYIANTAAVRLIVKKESEVEQKRDEETRLNKVIMRKVNICALYDATKLVAIRPYIDAPVITTETLEAGSTVTFAGTCVAGSTITIYVDGEPLTVEVEGVDVVQTATVTGTNWTYSIGTATLAEVYSVVASKANFAAKASATSLTVVAGG